MHAVLVFWFLGICAYALSTPAFKAAPFTENNRILGMILSYNYDHIDPLVIIINEYLSMCEAGWYPTVVIFTTMMWTDKLKRYLETKAHCYRIERSFPIFYSIFDPSISIGLGAEHRKMVGKEIHNYDLFIYHEDDIIVKYAHIPAYLHEIEKMDKLVPGTGLRDNMIGFQR